MVPIVEPELLIDGEHDAAAFEEANTRVISRCMAHLWQKNVLLEGTLLKPQMIIAGADYTGERPGPDEVAERTLRVLRRAVPAAVPGVMFLSGGQVGLGGFGGLAGRLQLRRAAPACLACSALPPFQPRTAPPPCLPCCLPCPVDRGGGDEEPEPHQHAGPGAGACALGAQFQLRPLAAGQRAQAVE